MAESLDSMLERLASLQAEHDRLQEQIVALQIQVGQAQALAAAEQALDFLPDDQRSVVIQAAAIQMGARPQSH